jgi:hypothetical protein
MGEFRVPGANKTDATDEELYEAIVKFAEQSFGEISEERIEGIRFRERDPKYEQDIIDVDVGDVFPISGEPVEAILFDESRDLYLVCTPTRGVAGGAPILVGSNKIQDIRYFD